MMHRLLVLLLAPVALAAQAVPRADTPRPGSVRVTFDPTIEIWGERFFDGRRERLGAPLSGDTMRGTYVPLIARIEQDVRTAGALPGFVASLGKGLLALRHERRTTPVTAEFGVTSRLSLGVTVPIVRVFTRVDLNLDTTGANLGLNPLLTDPAGQEIYGTFFSQFDDVLSAMQLGIDNGEYGCPGTPQCDTAMEFLAEARDVRNALSRTVYGTGAGGGAPFLPRDSSDGGLAIETNIRRIQQQLVTTYNVPGFDNPFLLPTGPVEESAMHEVLENPTYGFGVQPFVTTPPWLRYFPGDVEVAARYRLVARPSYAATIGALVRLPTGHLDSPNDALDISTGDEQLDVEAQLVQELVLLRKLWLNVSVRGGVQRAGERDCRVAPAGTFLAPRAAAARLRWDPGDYLAADVAPLYRFSPAFAVGFTAGYLTRRDDRYTFLTPEDSVDLADRMGEPTRASVLDAGTGIQRVRLGVAATYVGPTFEGGLSVEQTVSASGGPVARARVFRIVLRTSRKLF